MAADEDEECGICTGNLRELGGAIDLPCRCKVPYCQMCWDRTLAASLSKVGLPRCPSCRKVIRVDYDSKSGRLVFSRIADCTVGFSTDWLNIFDEALKINGLTRADEGSKFIVRTGSGQLTQLWVKLTYSLPFEKLQGKGLKQYMEGVGAKVRERENLAEADWWRDLSVRSRHGEELDLSGEACQDDFPVWVRFPRSQDQLLHTPGPDIFPLTVTFKEYVLTVDTTSDSAMADLTNVFRVTESGALQVIACEGSLGLCGKWKDQTSGVALHPGDWIIDVNGVTNDAEKISEELRKAGVLKIRVQQSSSIFKVQDVFSSNDMRKRLNEQAHPRQQDLLRQYGAKIAAASASSEPVQLMCVCGGVLEQLPLRNRLYRLVEPQGEDGILVHGGHKLTVPMLLAMRVVNCDLCSKKVEPEASVWTCNSGANTILHTQTFDICEQCFMTGSGALQRERELKAQQDEEYEASRRADEEKALLAAEAEAAAKASSASREVRLQELERLYPEPEASLQNQVKLCLRLPDGSQVRRAFLSSTPVSALYDFADLARGSGGAFKLREAHPGGTELLRSEDTLQEAGLCASVVLLMVPTDLAADSSQ
eukprot:TRINITY_DN33393_c0_g1_i1.p1 TRINITY_DN33393_c0_g1~~TRINITY_DN33393_c0_g1_i1.p1  ORF type:complete len:610 (-),score=136.76 TRINITY_DN33393_c0_g1_i1:83-1867(-)